VPDRRKFRFDADALDALEEILEWSEKKFHEVGRLRYQALIVQSARDIAADIGQDEIDWFQVRGRRVGIYHTAHSRNNIPDPLSRIQKPRHTIVFHIADDGAVVVLGFIHDKMLRIPALRRIIRSLP
jgi:toxin ParE1/3/4